MPPASILFNARTLRRISPSILAYEDRFNCPTLGMVLDCEGGGSPPAGKEASEIMEAMRKPEKALRYEVEVRERGQVEVTVPFSPGSRVVVLVFEEAEDPFEDLLDAAQTSLDFWDNPLDDEDWNRA